MPLTAANMFPGGPIKSADAIEYFNLLTGAMTDQPVTLANTLTAGGSHGVGSVPFRVNGVAAQTANMHEIRALATDVNPIFAIGPDGTLKWGPGGGTATDTTLSRSSPGALRVSGLAASVSNLLVNPGFEIWQRGGASVNANGAFGPDRWQLNFQGTGAGSLVKDTANQDTGGACAALASSAGGTAVNYVQLMQKMEDYVQLRGRPLTLSLRVKASIASNVVMQFADGVTSGGAWQSSGVISVGIGYQTLTFSFTPAATATSLFIGLGLQTVATLYCDSATLVVGSVALDYVPLTPADDLARCLRYYEIVVAPNAWAVSGYTAAAGSVMYWTFPFKVQKGGTPTVTVSGTFFGQATAQASPAVDVIDTRGFRFNITSNAAGIMLMHNNAQTGQIVAEWNP